MLHGQDPRSLGVVRLSRRPDVPVHLLETRSRLASGNGGYILMYGAQFVSDPVAFQLRNAVRSVFTRPHQMTLLLAYDSGLGTQPFEGSPASQVLLEAVMAFEQQHASGTN